MTKRKNKYIIQYGETPEGPWYGDHNVKAWTDAEAVRMAVEFWGEPARALRVDTMTVARDDSHETRPVEVPGMVIQAPSISEVLESKSVEDPTAPARAVMAQVEARLVHDKLKEALLQEPTDARKAYEVIVVMRRDVRRLIDKALDDLEHIMKRSKEVNPGAPST